MQKLPLILRKGIVWSLISEEKRGDGGLQAEHNLASLRQLASAVSVHEAGINICYVINTLKWF